MPSDHPLTADNARYADGQRAATRMVSARLTPHGVEIVSSDGPEILWPYAALSASVPLSRASSDVLLTSTTAAGASLFVASPAFVAALLARAPGLGTRAQRWRFARPLLAVAAVIAAAAGLVWALDLSPARALARLLPDATRTELGTRVVAQMAGNRKTCSKADGRAALEALAQRLTKAGGVKEPFKVTVVDWGLVNAFAAPGEQIVLTRGLIERAGGPDEIAGVLAHEMGHGIERHPETGLVRAIGLAAAAELMFGGSGTLSNIGVILAQFSYTRAAEREADEQALRLMQAAGIASQGIVDFFRRVEKMDSAGGIGNVEILRTHPLIPDRIRRAERQPGYPATPALTPVQWNALRAICTS